MKKITQAVLFDLLLIAMMYLWHVQGIDGARVFLQCILWVLAVVHWIIVLSGKAQKIGPVRGFYRFYGVVTTIALVFALIWLGLPYLAAVLFIGWALSTAMRNERPKASVEG